MNCCKETLPPAEALMARAVELARLGRGATAPNPCVGAVLVRDGAVVAQGWHEAFGGPHAEAECLRQAREKGVDTSACELYVTLEPCNHQGKTPPCTEAILAAGIRGVVVGCADPNPEVAGGGAQYLRSKGVDVRLGVLEGPCLDLIEDFRVWKTTDRPFVILKMAATLDGRIAARGGRPEQISCPESQVEAHRLRAVCRAVIVGGNTFYSDDPLLTCRLPGLAPDHVQPYAVVVTRRLPKAHNFKLLQDRPERVVFWTAEEEARSLAAGTLTERGCKVWGLGRVEEGLDLSQGLARLRSELSCWNVLCEGGGRLAMSLASQDLVDELVLFLAPKVLGDEQAKALFSGRKAQSLAEARDFRLLDCARSGQDVMLTYRPRRNG